MIHDDYKHANQITGHSWIDVNSIVCSNVVGFYVMMNVEKFCQTVNEQAKSFCESYKNEITDKFGVVDKVIQHGMKNLFANISARSEIALENTMNEKDKIFVSKDFLRKQMATCSMGTSLCNRRMKLSIINDDDAPVSKNYVDIVPMLTALSDLSSFIQLRCQRSSLYCHVNEDLLFVMCENIMSNAIKHGKQKEIIKMVLMLVSSHHAILEVTNKIEKKGKMNHDFSTSTKQHLNEGIGMYIIDRCAKKCGLRVEHKTTEEEYSVFVTFSCESKLLNVNSNVKKMCMKDDYIKDMCRWSICCIEDERMIRKVYEKILVKKYFDASRSMVIGCSSNEIREIIQKVLSGETKFDFFIIDENLNYGTESIKGSNIIQKMRKHGVESIMFIRSANTDEDDTRFYLKSGADAVMSKSMNSRDMFQRCMFEKKQKKGLYKQ
jgi:hypothetical protein